ncbi:hypothetical protein A0H81_03337 [Grifola frondosa]|uniref:Uncharacterized protein n=1 Tax=Grifola frondosa TaxID=5627 RepID=A0A1C7MI35_GRIFR|nr:hypothetical protein A0H81_03337 [Grifola frondosa]
MEDEQDEQYEDQTDETDDAEPPSMPPPAPAPLPALGPFMTPQATRSRVQRFSTGGPGTDAGPRRVRLVAPWKVADLVVPALKEEDDDGDATAAALARRERLTEEERNAIRERRRSALTEPDTFFGGQTPGEESAEETQVLLARMQQMVEGVRRRQSIGTPARASLSPRKRDGTFSLLAREAGGESLSARLARSALEEEEDRMDVDAEGEEDGESDKENGVVGDPRSQLMKTRMTRSKASRTTCPRASSRTPPMGDLRHMFSRSREEARATPKFAGLREMFASGSGSQGQGQMQTPQMDGVRAMFLRERAGGAETPAFEGIGEMLATPVGYRSSVAVAEEERMDIGEQQPEEVQPKQAADHEQPGVLEEAPEEAHEAAPTRTTRGRRTPTPTGTRRPPRSAVSAKEGGPSELQTVAEDVSTPDTAVGELAVPAPGARVVRRTRARTAESDQESTGIPKLTRARNARARVNHTLEEAPKSQTRSSTRRQNSVEVINVDDAAAAKPPRRTRKAEEPSSLPADETQTPASKPTRKTRAVKTPAAAASTSKTSAARRGTQTKSVEDAEENDDPLDSLTHPSAQDEAVPPPAAKVRRGARSKIPVGTVKQEDIEDSPALSQDAAAAPRAGRSRRTPVPAAASGSGAKSTVRTRAAAAAVAETPARSPSATPVGDKENTPEPQEEEEQTGGALVPATKVGTRGKATRSAAKAAVRRGTEEPVEKVADGARTRSGKTKVAKS